MKTVLVMTVIANLAFVTQATEMQREHSDSTTHNFSYAEMVGVFYNATFAPFVEGIRGTAESISQHSDDVVSSDDGGESFAVAPQQHPDGPGSESELATFPEGQWFIPIPEPSMMTCFVLGGILILLRRKHHPQE